MTHMRPVSRRRRSRAQVVYKSSAFLVRSVTHRAGGEAWLLCRPDGSRLAEFTEKEEAVFHAVWCEKHENGSYDATARHAARAAYERGIAR